MGAARTGRRPAARPAAVCGPRRGALRRLGVGLLVLAVAGALLGSASAAFRQTAANPSSFVAAASFPTYPQAVGENSPWAYHRGDEVASSASTSTAADSSGNARAGTYGRETNGPSLWWKLDDAGTAMSDSSGAANGGVLSNGIGSVAGRDGNAVSFNGATSNTTVSTPGAAVRTDASFTVSAWVYLTNASAVRAVVNQTGYPGGVASPRSDFWINSTGTRWSFSIPRNPADAASLVDVVVGTSAVQVNQWTSVTAVHDTAAAVGAKLRIYVNGVLENSAGHTVVAGGTGRFEVGRARDGSWGQPWTGSVDDVRTWRRALGDSEVALLGGRATNSWSFNEGAGTTTAYTGLAGSGSVTKGSSTTWNPSGYSGSALALPGDSNGYVQGAGAVVDTRASFTVSAWATLVDRTLQRNVVSQDASVVSGFYLKYSNGSDRWGMTIRAADSTSGANYTALSAPAPPLNTWTHLVGVFDEVARTVSMYVNGVHQQTVPFEVAPWPSTGPVQIGRGRWNSGYNDPHEGSIDEVRTYQRALTASQISALHAGSEPADAPATQLRGMTAGLPGALQGSQQGLQSSTAVAFGGGSNLWNTAPVAAPGQPAVTVGCWFRVSPGYSGGGLIGFASTPTNPTVTYDRVLYLNSAGAVAFGVSPAGGPVTLTSPGTYNDGAWHHVAASVGSAGLKLHVDGVRVAADAATTAAEATVGNGYWRIGGTPVAKFPNPPANPFLVGTLDEVSVIAAQLSDQQIAWHYHANH